MVPVQIPFVVFWVSIPRVVEDVNVVRRFWLFQLFQSRYRRLRLHPIIVFDVVDLKLDVGYLFLLVILEC